MKEFFDSQIPRYAILSHVWGSEEMSFPEMTQIYQVSSRKAGFDKIVKCCTAVKNLSIQYVWIDTCCIDKRNSADLSEAINSMSRYYREAALCLIFLEDVPGMHQWGTIANTRAEQYKVIRSSRWFTRGWTLQELIAPAKRLFLSKDWTSISHVIDDGELI